ncbi:MAG: hypothetical protein QM778_17000 [Myxococcales bacterium]
MDVVLHSMVISGLADPSDAREKTKQTVRCAFIPFKQTRAPSFSLMKLLFVGLTSAAHVHVQERHSSWFCSARAEFSLRGEPLRLPWIVLLSFSVEVSQRISPLGGRSPWRERAGQWHSRNSPMQAFYPDEITLERKVTLDALYRLYEELFPLPEEREPIEAFYEIMGLNENAPLQAQLGPWREYVVGLHPSEGGPIVGGHIFGVTTSAAHVAHGYQASAQCIYTFLRKDVRGRRAIEEFKRYFEDTALKTFGLDPGPSGPPLLFFEVNNPLRMSAADIAADTATSANPYLRYEYWRGRGFRPLDFDYVQPALREGVAPVRYLDLFCSAQGDAIPAEVLRNHLRAFVSISVRKGIAAEDDADFRSMLAQLERHEVRYKRADHPDLACIRDRAAAARAAAAAAALGGT